MSKLLMLKGLPASGKSTWAIEQERADVGRVLRVNKDTIRKSFNEPWSQRLENKVIAQRDDLIKSGLKAYDLVISDDTNFASRHERRLRQLAIYARADFEVKVFNTPLSVCLARDIARPPDEQVGEKVIMDMYTKYVEPNLQPQPVVPYVNDTTLPSGVICDLDGTLAIHNGRNPYDFARCDTDLVNKPVDFLLWTLTNCGTQVIYLSGRDDSAQLRTQLWLDANKCPAGPLFMRATGDKRKDAIVKRELFDKHVAGAYNVQFVLDDRDQVVKMWRDMGLTCLQVNYGNF